MLDLRSFYLNNIKSSSSYFKYFKEISTGNFEVVIYDDVNEAIQKFKELIQPGNESVYDDNSNFGKFILICYYINHHGYYIVQFPNYLSHPTNLSDFAYNKIRSHLITKGRSENGTVRWSERRIFIDELDFKSKGKINTNFHESIEERFKDISTRGASFDNMSNHEKLKEIANYLENVLKVDGKYRSIEKEEMLDLISDDFIMRYRKKLHCYRHSTDSSLEERERLVDKENFLIYLGISIIHGLYNNRNPQLLSSSVKNLV